MTEDTFNKKLSGSILILDDDEQILTALKRFLTPIGLKVHIAQTGNDALAFLEENTVDVVMSDMRMPEMNGAEFLAQVASKYPHNQRILLTAFSDFERTIQAINKGHIYGYINKPWNDDGLILTIERAIQTQQLINEKQKLLDLTQQQNQDLLELNTTLETRVTTRTTEIQQAAEILSHTYHELHQNFTAVLHVFSNLIDLQEGYNNGHARHIGEQVTILANRMNCDEQLTQDIYYAGLLMNIGTIGMPTDLLSKPYMRLNEDEKNRINKHPLFGTAILQGIDQLENACEIIRIHHERLNGSGYPDGLQGGEIPMSARIIGVIDDYHSLLQGKLFPQRYSAEEAKSYLIDQIGILYDGEVVQHFLESLDNRIDSLKEIQINSTNLIPNMVLSRDIISFEGKVLEQKEQMLTTQLIETIINHENESKYPFTLYIKANQ